MVEALFSFLLLAISVHGFLCCHCLLGVNTVYLGLYKGMFEKAVVVASSTGEYEPYPYFDMGELRREVEEYFALNLPKYTTSYGYELSPLRFASSNKPTKVSLVLNAWVLNERKIQKKAVFALERR